MDYEFLLDLGLIILVAQIIYLIVPKLHIPKILGGILAGIILGPAITGIVHPSITINILSELSVIFIMFLAGMHTSLKKILMKTKHFIVIAVLGAVIPFILAMLFSTTYTKEPFTNFLFGAVITATSASITVQALIEMKKFNTKVGLAIMGSSFVNDIIGVAFLSFIMNDGKLSLITIGTLVYHGILFLIISLIVGFILFNIFAFLKTHNWLKNNLPFFAIAFCLIFAFFAEKLGLSGIIGAYIIGMIIGTTKQVAYVRSKVETLVSMFFEPIFAVSIGLKVYTLNLPSEIWTFILAFTVVVFISKLLGNSVGAYNCGYKKRESIQIGLGMATGGEFSYIMIDEAKNKGLINDEIFTIILLTVVFVTFIAPILLQLSFFISDKLDQKKKELKE